MKEYVAAGGETRLWYEPDEIEMIVVSELVSAKLMPKHDDDDLAVDVENLVESHLSLRLDQYAELDSHVLGITEFCKGESPKVSINKDLTGSALDEEDATPGLIGRWRATVAHEAAHVMLHRHLYEVDPMQRGLFRPDTARTQSQRLLRCLKRDVGYNQQPSDWREVQANMGMGAILMPRPVFVEAARRALSEMGLEEKAVETGSRDHGLLVERLAELFSVSKQAARIRLSRFGIVHAEDAPPL